MSEAGDVRRVRAAAGWIVDLPYPDQSGNRALWAVVEWEFNVREERTNALCLGPLGRDLEGSALLTEVRFGEHPDLRVRLAPDQLSGAS